MEQRRPKGSGFEAPTIGTIFPKGSTIRKNSDGTVSIIPPENAGNNRRHGSRKGKRRMPEKAYFTLTGTNHYFGKEFLKPGMRVKLIKEPDNEYDSEAIRVELEGLGKIGYVANSTGTVLGESMSAGRLYDHLGKKAEGKVVIVTDRGVVCKLCKK